MGKLIYLKNGEKNEKTFTDDYKDDYCEEADELVKQDYTVIISYENCLYVDLAKSFLEKDYDNLMETISTYTEEEQKEMIITNHAIRNELEDYDVYDFSHVKYIMDRHRDRYTDEHYNKITQNRKPIKALDIFARQKIGKLNFEEEKMYDKYINFDLDFLLFSEESDTLTLNTDNSGFVTIFEDCIYKNPNTTDAHSETMKKHEKWYKQSHHGNPDNRVLVYIFKGTAVFFMPESINGYQKEELSSIIEEMDDLCKFHNKDITIEVSIEDKNREPLGTLESLPQLKQRFVQNKESKGK